LVLPPLPSPWAKWLHLVGLRQEEHGELIAAPFSPDWMFDESTPDGMDGLPRRARLDERTPAEAHLSSLGYCFWQSPAQKEAAWRVMTSPPGSTSLVVLPTGTGKSLLFQLLARFARGLTVVVVPTIALAIDQCRAASILSDLSPAYFAAGEEAESTLASVESRQTRLVFTSPEACVSGRLRGLLAKAASEGWLDNLVIDEVHVVDTWGAYFRVDFQLLSGLRREWVETDGQLRTLLLTATATRPAIDDLRTLFAPAPTRPWIEFVSQRLRPEMAYFQRDFGNDAERRDEAVEEALWRLPRPAIFYVTERDEARKWHARLGELGFRRIGCFHGDTSPRQRRDLLARWRSDEIDLMVATSAFGLGVDKQDVRAVIHACFPEDMNRYYQEVGRGGRDGWSAPCLLLPTRGDYEVAYGLGPRYMTPQLLQQRWRAMWETARQTERGDTVWQLDTSAVREGMLGRRTGEENVRWNKRLLLQMHRAGLLRLRGLRYERLDEEERGREWLEVELRSFSPDSPRVGELVEESRRQDIEESDRGLAMVGEYLRGSECIGRTLRQLYGDGTQRVCGGCRWCRLNGEDRSRCPPLEWEDGPEEHARPALLAECPTDEMGLRRFLRSFLEAGVYRFIAAPHRAATVRAALAAMWPALRIDLRRPYRVDSGPVRLLPGETAAILHFSESTEAGFGGGRRVHCFGPPLTAQQLRYALEARGGTVTLFTSVSQWRQSEEGSHVHS
jgi:ATP-dependent DNA helicase RecQ